MADYKKFPDAPEGTPESQFVHLHVHSDYSLLDGVSKIDSLVAKAKLLGMKSLALTDHGNMYGALNFEHLCRINGINPVVGEEFYVTDDHLLKEKTRCGTKYYHLILLCENATGYKNMSWLSSRAFTEGFYNKPRIDFEMLRERHEGLICLSACIQGEIPQLLLHGKDEEAEEVAKKYSELFGKDRFYLEIQDHGLEEQKKVLVKLVALAKKLGLPLVATNDIHYCNKEDAESQDVLRCIGFKKLLKDPHQTMGDGRSEWYMKTESEMRSLFPEYPEAISNTLKIASMCNLTIPQYKTQELKNCLPHFPIPAGFQNEDAYLRHIVETGLVKRYGTVTEEIKKRAEYEMGIIFQMGFSGYFLIVWEFINWSKEHGIPIGPGRGSGAGSIVAYAMTITDIDPIRFGLIFERFLNPERISMPDFDVDIDYDFRQDVIEHTRELYGEAQVGHIVTFGTLKAKAVIADVGRVLDIPLAEVNILKKCIPGNPKAKLKDAFTLPDEAHPDNGQLIQYKDDPRYQKLFELCFKLENVNRNTGLHASGMVIGLTALPDWAPIMKDNKTGEVATQYTMDIIEPCGLVKMDYLGLKTLSLIRYAEEIINRHKKEGEPNFSVADVSDTDAETFEMFQRGESSAIFQFESAGMQKVLRQAKPTRLEDLVALNALYRPGPMDYIPQFIDGRFHPEKIHYPDPCLQDILEETYGVMVYQEQVMQVAQRIAGYSLGQADMLRRAMGKKKPEVMAAEKVNFVEGAVKNGFDAKHAEDIFEIMVPFAGYGFNKSHAAAYTVLAYRTAWLKCHKPAEFMAANLTNEITSTDKLPEYLEETRRMGIPVDPPDVNRSDMRFDVVDGRIVFGLLGIKGMGENAAANIVSERKNNGEYKGFMDFLERVDTRIMNKRTYEALIKTGAFDKFEVNRPTLLFNLEKAIEYVQAKNADAKNGQEDLFGGTGEQTFPDFVFTQVDDLPRMEKLNQERELIGSYVSGHPLDDFREYFETNAVTLTSQTMERAAKDSAAQAKNGDANGEQSWQTRRQNRNANLRRYTVLGLLSELKTHTIAKGKNAGKEMAFGKIQDFSGGIDLTFFNDVWEKIRQTTSLKVEEPYAFSGYVDASRDIPAFIVESMENPNSLKAHAVSEFHIELEDSIKDENSITQLRDFLFGKEGNCSVYFHIDTAVGNYVVKCNSQITLSPDDDVVKTIKYLPLVKSVWTC